MDELSKDLAGGGCGEPKARIKQGKATGAHSPGGK